MVKSENVELIDVHAIIVDDRIRKDYGDLSELRSSVEEYGLIQPIVLVKDNGRPKLIVGGRRLEVIKQLKWSVLEHGSDFIWNDEQDALRQKSIELEENLRRKELSWVEQVNAKQKLLEVMQSIHGTAKIGHPTKEESSGASQPGFGVNKLAAMLGESAAQTSKDLQVARALAMAPALARAETKESALRQLRIVATIIEMRNAAKPEQQGERWTLYEGDFRDHAGKVSCDCVDLVYCDLPFGVELSQMSKHATGPVEYPDERGYIVGNLQSLTDESFRVLRNDRYIVLFFGFNYYSDLVQSLQNSGFIVNPVPVIWYKRTRSTENPNTRYANAYDAAIVAVKGNPVFIRPGQANVIDLPAIPAGQKLHIAQQPVELVQRFILDMTASGATVLDWMAGSGTTGEAALRINRKVVLFEREAQACKIIRARLSAI